MKNEVTRKVYDFLSSEIASNGVASKYDIAPMQNELDSKSTQFSNWRTAPIFPKVSGFWRSLYFPISRCFWEISKIFKLFVRNSLTFPSKLYFLNPVSRVLLYNEEKNEVTRKINDFLYNSLSTFVDLLRNARDVGSARYGTILASTTSF